MKFVLTQFAQTLPEGAVAVEVLAVDEVVGIRTAITCPPIEGLSAQFDNAELLAAVCKATGHDVTLPE